MTVFYLEEIIRYIKFTSTNDLIFKTDDKFRPTDRGGFSQSFIVPYENCNDNASAQTQSMLMT